jgi:hypothetical protein
MWRLRLRLAGSALPKEGEDIDGGFLLIRIERRPCWASNHQPRLAQ